MKAFIVSLCIAFALILLIAFNAVYINKVANELISRAGSTSVDNYNELILLWEKRKLIISLCANHKEVDKIEEQIILIKNAAMSGNKQELDTARVLVMNYIEQIKRHEELTIDNIL